MFLHGILGSRANWRTFGTRFVERVPSWSALLVDLPGHGDSGPLPEPPELDRTARMLDGLLGECETAGRPVRLVVGHSLGGKLALVWSAGAPGPRHVVVVDVSPAARPRAMISSPAARVLDVLDGLPSRVETRARFVALVRQAGLDEATARWLAMSLRPDGSAWRLRFDRVALRRLLVSHYAFDAWPIVRDPPTGMSLHFVVGGRSEAVDASDRAELARLHALDPSRWGLTIIDGAGHDVHVDAPDVLLDVLAQCVSVRGTGRSDD
ncbi:MAG: alpha/beta hydrolase [Myxococcota bacterium]|nr:alpha/beta hydrolase [Myxococcota bacterium]MDW8361049.1 alpha/beta hydrolase [Myxococcales bacterium]